MKKIMTIMGVFGLIFVQAQVGINQDVPKATLDVVAGKADGSQVEGLLVPRISKKSAHTMAVATIKPQESNLVYVDDLSTTFNVPAGDTTVTDITEKGYYFWNGIKWERIASKSSAEWVYDPATKQVNLQRSNAAPFTNKVYYNEKGAYKDYDETSVTHYNHNGLYTEDLVTGGNVLQRNAVNVEELLGARILSRNHLNLTSNDPASTTDNTRMGAVFNINKYPGNNNNYRHIAGVNGGYKVGGGGTDESVRGLRGLVYYGQGSTANVSAHATAVEALIDFNSSGTAKNILGVRANTSQGANAGNITNLAGVRAGVGVYGTSSITNIFSVRAVLYGTGSANVTNAYGYYYKGIPSTLSANITNAYGLYINDIEKGTTNNFAIYTKKGVVYHHDKVGIGTLTPTEKLEVIGTIKATKINFTGLPTYANDAAAGAGGLVSGDCYKTATGELRIKL